MERFSMRCKYLLSVIGIAAFCGPVFAQTLPQTINPSAVTNPGKITDRASVDPAAAADHAREVSDMLQWTKLRAQYRKQETSDPKAAIGTYQSFLTSHTWHPTVAITAADVVARLDIAQMKDTSKAGVIYQWTQTNYAGNPAMARTISGRAMMLDAEGKYQEAADLLKDNWENILGIDVFNQEYVIAGLRAWDEALGQLKHEDQLIEPMAKAFFAVPLTLDDHLADSGWAYDTIIKVLLDAKRGKEATGWARLRFEETDYSERHIAVASKKLTDTWKIADPDSKGWEGFVRAQASATVANPLLQYALPVPDGTLWKKSFDALSTDPTYRSYLIKLLIAKGDYGDAMKVAQAMGEANAQSSRGVEEACRVFKAAQLNLLGANQLINSLQGKGDDPLPEFYKANPSGKVDLQP
jgi:hypothetical protein